MIDNSNSIKNQTLDSFDLGKNSVEELIKKTESILGKDWLKKLTSYTDDNININPIYFQRNQKNKNLFDQNTHVCDSNSNLWDIRCISSHPDPKEANKLIINDLEGGATSIRLKIDRNGFNGTVIKSINDLEELLENVYLDLAPIYIENIGPSIPIALCLSEIIDKKIDNNDTFRGNFGVDPLTSLCENGRLITDLQLLYDRIFDLAKHCSEKFKNSKLFNVSTLVYHNSGCSEAQELAIALSVAINYVREMNSRGFDIEDAFNQIAFTLTCDSDFFLTISKFRSLRVLWKKMYEYCGLKNQNYFAPTEAITAPRMLATTDPWINILRCTTACFSASISSVDAITVMPFDSCFDNQLPSILSRRIARNTQIILQEESFLDHVVDPSNGSYFVDNLTSDLSFKAWELFRDIEKNGGIHKVLLDGKLQASIEKKKQFRDELIEKRRRIITGVNDYPTKFKKEINTKVKKIDLNKTLAQKSSSLNLDSKNLIGPILNLIKNNVPIDEINESLSEKPIEMTPLKKYRLSENFEKIDAGGKDKISIFVINFGDKNNFSFLKNILEIGGIKIILGSPHKKNIQVFDEFIKSETNICIICPSTGNSLELEKKLIKKISNNSLKKVYISGDPNKNQFDQLNLPYRDFIYNGCNILSLLREIYEISEAKR